MNMKNKISIGKLVDWSLKRRFLTFTTVFTIVWGFIDPFFALLGKPTPLSFLGPWRYLGLVIISALFVSGLELGEKKRFKGRLSLVSFEIVLQESGARYNVEAPKDMRVEEFVSSFMTDISKSAPPRSLLARADMYDNALVIYKKGGAIKECEATKSLKENGVGNGTVCRIQGKIKLAQANAYYLGGSKGKHSAKTTEGERGSSQYQFLYSLIGLFFGLLISVVGFSILLTGSVGAKSWTAIMTGVKSPGADIVFGSGLFIAGLLTVFLTRYDRKMTRPESAEPREEAQEEPPMRYTIPHDRYNVLPSIKNIVDEAIAESATVTYESFRDELNLLDGLPRLRQYYGNYFKKLIPLASALDGTAISEGAELINDFFRKTALNAILDSWYASYVIKDYILDLNRIIESKGAELGRVQYNLKYLTNTWDEIDKTTGKYEFLDADDLKRILLAGG